MNCFRPCLSVPPLTPCGICHDAIGNELPIAHNGLGVNHPCHVRCVERPHHFVCASCNWEGDASTNFSAKVWLINEMVGCIKTIAMVSLGVSLGVLSQRIFKIDIGKFWGVNANNCLKLYETSLTIHRLVSFFMGHAIASLSRLVRFSTSSFEKILQMSSNVRNAKITGCVVSLIILAQCGIHPVLAFFLGNSTVSFYIHQLTQNAGDLFVFFYVAMPVAIFTCLSLLDPLSVPFFLGGIALNAGLHFGERMFENREGLGQSFSLGVTIGSMLVAIPSFFAVTWFSHANLSHLANVGVILDEKMGLNISTILSEGALNILFCALGAMHSIENRFFDRILQH